MDPNHTEIGENGTFIPEPSARSYTDYWQYVMYIYTLQYVSPVLITVGTVCNILSLTVLNTDVYRNSSTGFLLSALAIADIGVLNTGLLRVWIKSIWKEVDLRLFGTSSCKLHIFFTYFFSHLSAWTLSLVTLERVICVCVPLKIRDLCSIQRMASGWAVLCSILILFNMPLFWSVDVVYASNKKRCAAKADHEYYINVVWQWLDLFLVSFGPFLVIFVGNIVIVGKMVSMYRRRKDMTHSSSQNDKTTSTTFMLLVVSMTFLLTTSPSAIYFVGMAYKVWPADTEEQLAQLFAVYAVCYTLYYMNNTTNFFLYCASGSRFRLALKRLCCKDFAYKESTSASRIPATQATGTAKDTDVRHNA